MAATCSTDAPIVRRSAARVCRKRWGWSGMMPSFLQMALMRLRQLSEVEWGWRDSPRRKKYPPFCGSFFKRLSRLSGMRIETAAPDFAVLRWIRFSVRAETRKSEASPIRKPVWRNVSRKASSLSSFACARMFWTSFSWKGKRGITFTLGGRIAFAGFVWSQPCWTQKLKNARRKPSSLLEVRGLSTRCSRK